MVDEMGFVRLGARFEPTTRKIGFVAAAPGDVAGATAGWIRSLGDGTGVDEIPGGLEATLTRMGALVSGRTKVLPARFRAPLVLQPVRRPPALRGHRRLHRPAPDRPAHAPHARRLLRRPGRGRLQRRLLHRPLPPRPLALEEQLPGAHLDLRPGPGRTRPGPRRLANPRTQPNHQRLEHPRRHRRAPSCP